MYNLNELLNIIIIIISDADAKNSRRCNDGKLITLFHLEKFVFIFPDIYISTALFLSMSRN